MPTYLFDLGNSSEGPVGYCARVRAASPAEAAAIMREAMHDRREIERPDHRFESVDVYFNPEAITEADITEVDDDGS